MRQIARIQTRASPISSVASQHCRRESGWRLVIILRIVPLPPSSQITPCHNRVDPKLLHNNAHTKAGHRKAHPCSSAGDLRQCGWCCGPDAPGCVLAEEMTLPILWLKAARGDGTSKDVQARKYSGQPKREINTRQLYNATRDRLHSISGWPNSALYSLCVVA